MLGTKGNEGVAKMALLWRGPTSLSRGREGWRGGGTVQAESPACQMPKVGMCHQIHRAGASGTAWALRGNDSIVCKDWASRKQTWSN